MNEEYDIENKSDVEDDKSDVEDDKSEIDEDENITIKKNKIASDDELDVDDDDELDDDDDDDDEDDDNDNIQSPLQNYQSSNMLDLDDDDSDDDDFDNFEKFQNNTVKNVISDYYPELISHNYEEIDNLTKIVRDDNGNIIDPFHKTLPFLSRYERARIIGERSKQLENNSKPFIDLEPNEIDSYTIAMKEFQLKKIPFIIKRPLPNGACEYWKLSDLEII